jgi:putative ABC transport system ATP-binding protein
MANLVIDINGIGKTYKIGEVVVNALVSVDLKIAKGEYVALMGPSG